MVKVHFWMHFQYQLVPQVLPVWSIPAKQVVCFFLKANACNNSTLKWESAVLTYAATWIFASLSYGHYKFPASPKPGEWLTLAGRSGDPCAGGAGFGGSG